MASHVSRQRKFNRLRPRRSGKGWGTVLLVLMLVVSLIINLSLIVRLASAGLLVGNSETTLTQRFHSGNRQAQAKVAILRAEGLIAEGEGSYLKQQIDQVRNDDQIRAIVLRVDSPGGTVTASDYLYHHLVKLAKEKNVPMVVSIGSIAASGGYYIAMASGEQPNADQYEKIIFAEPTSFTGSIGVYIPLYGLTGLTEQVGVEDRTVASQPLKLMGSPLDEFTDEEKAVFETLVNSSYDRFKGIVKSGRPDLDDEGVQQVATGQIFTTEQALSNGLVDEEGYLEDAVTEAASLAGLAENEYRAVEYEAPLQLFGGLLSQARQPSEAEVWYRMAQAGRPQAYYLWGLHPFQTALAR